MFGGSDRVGGVECTEDDSGDVGQYPHLTEDALAIFSSGIGNVLHHHYHHHDISNSICFAAFTLATQYP